MSRERWLVVGGQAAGQLATVVTLPLLTRVLDPASMGLYQAAFAIGVILQPVASLRLEFLLPAVRGERELRRLIRLSTWSQFLSGIAAVGVFSVLVFVGMEEAGHIAAMAGMIMLAYAWTVLDNALLMRAGALHRLAIRNLLAGSLTAMLQILVALVYPNVLLLAASIIVGRAIAILSTRTSREASAREESLDEDAPWTVSRSVYSVLSGLVSSASLQGLTVYVSAGFGAAAAGAVGVAQRSASAPVAFLSQGLSQYSQTRIAAELRDGSDGTRRELVRQIRGTAPIAVLAVIGLAVLGPLLSPFVFGAGWPEVGTVIAVLSVPIGLQLLLSPVLPVFVMLGHERRLFWIQLGRLLLAVAGAALGQFLFDGLIASVVGFALGNAVGYVLTFFAVFRAIR